jgi:integrase
MDRHSENSAGNGCRRTPCPCAACAPGDLRRKRAKHTARETEDRFEALYVLAFHCGLREGELLGLKWDDIDPSGATATLHVRRTLSQTRTGHIFEKPKNCKGRSIKCSQKATDALGRHRSRQNQERFAAGPLWEDNDLVFPTLTGTTKSGTNLLGRHF